MSKLYEVGDWFQNQVGDNWWEYQTIVKKSDGDWYDETTGEWFAQGILHYDFVFEDIFEHWLIANDIGPHGTEEDYYKLMQTDFDIYAEIYKWQIRENKHYLLNDELDALYEYICEELERME